MAVIVAPSPDFLCQLCDALGVSRKERVTRIVLDVPFNGVATAYVQRRMTEEQAAAAVKAIAAIAAADQAIVVEAGRVDVDEKGNVRATRRDQP